MNEWFAFALTAALLLLSLGFFTAGVIGNIRFGGAMNRIHAAGLGDTTGMLFITLAMLTSSYTPGVSIRSFLPLIFLWVTSPVSSHFLALMEYRQKEPDGIRS